MHCLINFSIREAAYDQGLIPRIPVAEGTRYADFTGYVLHDVQLPEYLWKAKDRVQGKWLDESIGGKVEGYTWHHHQDDGRMQLVPLGIHNATEHEGGRSAGHWAYGRRQ